MCIQKGISLKNMLTTWLAQSTSKSIYSKPVQSSASRGSQRNCILPGGSSYYQTRADLGTSAILTFEKEDAYLSAPQLPSKFQVITHLLRWAITGQGPHNSETLFYPELKKTP